jgi:hypothetical protein
VAQGEREPATREMLQAHNNLILARNKVWAHLDLHEFDRRLWAWDEDGSEKQVPEDASLAVPWIDFNTLDEIEALANHQRDRFFEMSERAESSW